MLGAIAGDIIGSRFEGRDPPGRDFELWHPHCRFTDDSICTIAIAHALLGDRDYAASLRSFVRRHRHRGYGGMFRNWAAEDDAPPYGSWGNGAPMRVAAIGWFAADETEALELAEAQSAVTHNHPDAIVGAQAVALAILLGRQGEPPVAIRARIVEHFGYDLAPATALKPGIFDVSASGTVPPALTAVCETRSWEDAVRTAVALGGDADTLGSIAVAEAVHGLPADVAQTARGYLTDDLAEVLARFERLIGAGPD